LEVIEFVIKIVFERILLNAIKEDVMCLYRKNLPLFQAMLSKFTITPLCF
jgi:hypothetical protein